MRKNTLRIGTSGYNYRDWKGRFYPEKLVQREWLSYFSERFSTVEINNSFYVATKPETYQKWYEQTPDEFLFAVKGHRYITQYKKLIDVEEAVEQFFSSCTVLNQKLGVVLWQFPASFRISVGKEEIYLERFSSFLQLLPKDIRQAFEFRDASWYRKEVYELIHANGWSLVQSDSPRFPLLPDMTQPFQYIRFHGPGALYATKYSEKELTSWAKKITQYLQESDVYCYFNNDISGHAIENAETLRKLLGEKV